MTFTRRPSAPSSNLTESGCPGVLRGGARLHGFLGELFSWLRVGCFLQRLSDSATFMVPLQSREKDIRFQLPRCALIPSMLLFL
ncbi:hypothetical protein STEG23_009559 [Scotinomys teguina]